MPSDSGARDQRFPAAAIDDAIDTTLPLLRKPGVVALRPGYQFTNGWITKKPAIVAYVREKKAGLSPELSLPREAGGFAVDVRQAPPHLQLAFDENPQAFPIRLEAFSTGLEEEPEEEPAPRMDYTPPTGVALAEVTGQMTIRCSAGPDAGFPELKAFLEATEHHLTVGMYEFSVRHIVNALLAGLAPNKPLRLTLDSKEDPGGDITEVELFELLGQRLSNRLVFAWAPVRGRKTVTKWAFPSAYHIKVAVKDGTSFWLSSGNWTRASQPDKPTANWPAALTSSNREWHVVVEHQGLARVFEAYLNHDIDVAATVQSGGLEGDMETDAGELPAILLTGSDVETDATPGPPVDAAKFSGTVRVMPLLTPDNFVQHVADLIERARERFYMQTQYINVRGTGTPSLQQLVGLIKDKQDAGLDIRIILRGDGNGAQEQLEGLTDRGLEPERVKFQRRVHNKGIVVDSKIAVVGSHNWSEAGVTVNRDASLIVKDERIAKYFEAIFIHDWTRRAKHFVHNEQDRPLIVGAADAVPPGVRMVSWSDYYSAQRGA